MRTYLYKRTHAGDPDERGRLGVYDCIVSKRSLDFDSVIGIGGIGQEAKSHNLDGKLTWIGIGRHDSDESILTFDHFVLWDAAGPDFAEIAPLLAARMLQRYAPRGLINFNAQEQLEIDQLLELAKHASPSPAMRKAKKNICPPKKPIC